jgi:hypothetical protein
MTRQGLLKISLGRNSQSDEQTCRFSPPSLEEVGFKVIRLIREKADCFQLLDLTGWIESLVKMHTPRPFRTL